MPIEVFTQGLSHPAVVERMATSAEASGWDGMFVGREFRGRRLRGPRPRCPRHHDPAARHRGQQPGHPPPGRHGRRHRQRAPGLGGPGHPGHRPRRLGPRPPWSRPGAGDRPGALRHHRPCLYLAGDSVPFDDLAPHHRPDAQPLDQLGLANAPESSRLHFLDPSLSPPPVEVAAIWAPGPRRRRPVRRPGPARRRRRSRSGGVGRRAGPGHQSRGIPIGAFVNVVVHDDPDNRPPTRRRRCRHLRPLLGHGRPRPHPHRRRQRLGPGRRGTPPTTWTSTPAAGRPRPAPSTRRSPTASASSGPAEHCLARLRALAAVGHRPVRGRRSRIRRRS